jgi:uncharacterized phage infection (PIP) family protein YhgE
MAKGILAKLRILITGDNDDLKASVAESKQEVESLGRAGKRAGEDVDGGFSRASRGVDRLSQGASRVQEAFAKLIIPFTFVAAVAGLVDQVRSLSQGSREFEKGIDGAIDNLEKRLKNQVRSNALSGLQQQLAEVSDEVDSISDQILEKFDTAVVDTNALQSTLRKSVEIFENLTGIDTTIKTVAEAQQEAFEGLEDASARGAKISEQVIKNAAADFAKTLETLDQTIGDSLLASRVDELTRAGDKLGATAKQLELESTKTARERAQLVEDLNEGVRQFGEQYKQTADRVLADFDALSKRQADAIREQGRLAQEQYFKPFIDALDRSTGSGFTTRLDALTARMQSLERTIARGQ